MPSRSLPSPPVGLTRRTAITTFAVGFGGMWAGCTNERDPIDPSPQGADRAAENSERLDPDATVASMALANEQSTLDALEATAGRHPELAGILSPVIAAHSGHVRLLADAAPDAAPDGRAAASPSPSPSDPVEQGARRHWVPREPRAALNALSANEQDLSTSNKRHAFVAQSGAFARLLASMAGSAAQHAEGLSRPLPTRPASR